ncbi:amino acid adenylation domain-containing protein [Micromonospora sp. Llam0]|uniref:non-ribosomal peptide synthetase n=1 Tax=Micromonospora sp. Llam0 TaxID=2485143 RepID=UPI000FBECEE7|nr:amino acid adenylation domain-containing protein [Micromonospora sp. Llam0]ROO60625.1 amino acid adenylation domain-containing protein [Micromonospora sp. Llam0]
MEGTTALVLASERQVALVQAVETGRVTANSVAYLECRLRLVPGWLRRVVTETCAANPVLRSTFDLRPGTAPALVARAGVQPDLIILDGTDDGHGETPSSRETAARPFPLDGAALARIVAVRRGAGGFGLVLASHPALLDRTGQRMLMAEILERYTLNLPASRTMNAGALAGQPGPSARPSAELVAAWAGSFDGLAAAPPDFWISPADDDDTEPPGHRSAEDPLSWEVPLPGDVAARVETVAARLAVAVPDVLFAAHAKAVAMATGKADLAIGAEFPSAADVLARIAVRPGTWESLIREVRRAADAATAWAHLSHSRVRKLLGVASLVDAGFAYSERSVEADLLDGAHSRLALLAGGHGGGDLAGHGRAPFEGQVLAEFFRGPATGRLRLRLTAGPGLTGAQLALVAGLHERALRHCLSGAETHESLSALSSRQRQLILSDWNGQTRPYDLGRPLHELIEEQVRRTPDAPAVTDSSDTLSYARVNSRANRLARRLRATGARPGSVIAVCVRRDAGMLVDFLAVLKSGAAYLPLDAAQPAERLTYMLRDARAIAVLTDASYADGIPDGPWTVLRADDDVRNEQFPAGDLGRTSTASDLMYVVYTSGSTGVPKGVEVPHRGVVNHLRFGVEQFAGEGRGGAAVFSSPAFDMIVPNLYVPLLMGQRVSMIEEDHDLRGIAERLRQLAPFAFLKLTPGQLDALCDLLAPEDARRLVGKLVVGADAFPVRTLRRWRRLDPWTPIFNDYGPTEASVANSDYLTAGDEEGELLPIGRPNPNTTMYILDRAGAPVPVGVPGDLYIGGVCVVRGYVGKPELTRERFVPDVFSGEPGARMYRTGDVARWLPSGVIEFLGREDGQMKIRGYRIEPAEVEAAMTSHPAVTGAAVRGIGGTRQNLALAGYYVATGEIDPEELWTFLGTVLPDYLVPSFLDRIPKIPLTANGKIDRGALPAPARCGAGTGRQRRAAAGPAGRAVALAWRDAYGGSPPSIGDPITPPSGDPIAEVQFAVCLAGAADISTATAIRLVSAAGTFGHLCEQTHAAMQPPPGRPVHAPAGGQAGSSS